MSNYYGPKISTDGLQFYLDAANTKSYTSGSTTWYDLSGNAKNGALINGPTYTSSFNGGIVFNGTNDYVSETVALSDLFWQGNWTLSAWVNLNVVNTGGSNNDRPIIQHGTSSLRSGLHLTQRNGTFFFGMYGDDMGGTATLVAKTWYNIVFTLNNTSKARQIILNGKVDASGTAGGSYVGTGSNTRIGGALLFGLYFNGIMSYIMAYNRVLSLDEITQNYNATKTRYEL